jgi:hypothetical protein
LVSYKQTLPPPRVLLHKNNILHNTGRLSGDKVAKETTSALLPYLNHGVKQTPKGTLLIVDGKELHPRDYEKEVAKIIDRYRDHIVEKHDIRPRFVKEMIG